MHINIRIILIKSFSLILALIIHLFLFLFLYTIVSPTVSHVNNNIISLKFMPMLNKKAEVEHIKENIPTNKRISHKISTEKKENESGIIIDVTEQINHPITNQNISDSQNTSHNNEVKTDPTSIIKKNLPNQNLEFTKHTATIFSQAMEIPESLLGQEIFPRKYLAIFQLNRSTNQELTSVEFLGLSPQSDSLTYVDKTLFTHFKKHFNLLEKIKILEYFKQYSDNPVNIVLIFTEN